MEKMMGTKYCKLMREHSRTRLLLSFREKQQLEAVRKEAHFFSKFIQFCKVLSQELFNFLHISF